MAFPDAATAGKVLAARRRKAGIQPQAQVSGTPDMGPMMPAMRTMGDTMALKERFIQQAIKRPGQLHRDLGVPQGQKIPGGKLRAALAGRYGAKTAQRARFARTLSGLRK